jgi:hypothetical protein
LKGARKSGGHLLPDTTTPGPGCEACHSGMRDNVKRADLSKMADCLTCHPKIDPPFFLRVLPSEFRGGVKAGDALQGISRQAFGRTRQTEHDENGMRCVPRTEVYMPRLPLIGLDAAEISESLAVPAFRARQIYDSIYRQYATDAGSITSLPKELPLAD